MKLKLIIAGIIALLLVSLVIANKDSLQDLFVNKVDKEVSDKVLNIINTMTPQQALEMRMKELTKQNNNGNKASEVSEEII